MGKKIGYLLVSQYPPLAGALHKNSLIGFKNYISMVSLVNLPLLMCDNVKFHGNVTELEMKKSLACRLTLPPLKKGK